MRILWHSSAPDTPNGYGTQTKLFTKLIKVTEGLDVVVSAFYGVEGYPIMTRDKVLVIPRFKDVYGNDVVGAHMKKHGCDAVITLIDPFVLTGDVWAKLNTVMWCPVDCAPVSPENWDVMERVPRLWSMSRFGHDQIIKRGYDEARLDYVPLGVDTDLFCPIDKGEARARAMQFLGRDDLADKFIVMTVAANKGVPSRKNMVGMLRAFKKLAETRADAVFYMHTEPTGMVSHGEDLGRLVADMDLTDKVIFPPNYDYVTGFISGEIMNDLYNMADVFLLLSLGEGFGAPIIEAQAAGVPVIVTKGSAMAELGIAGVLIDATPIAPSHDRTGCYWWMADEDDAAWELDKAYLHRDDYRREAARVFALGYDYRLVYEKYMLPALLKLADISAILPTNTTKRDS